MYNNLQWYSAMQLFDLELFSEAELDGLLRILAPYEAQPMDMLRTLGQRMELRDKRGLMAGTAEIRKSKAGKILSDVLFYGLLLCLVCGALLLSQGDKRPILGYSFMNVISGSMQSVYPVDSLVVIKETDQDAIQIGNDITYMKDAETAVTHRVIGITEDYEGTGERGFETQGVDNDAPDFEIVRAANVIGVVKFHVPGVGQWLEWLRGNLVITLCFTAGILLLATLLKGAFKKAPEAKNEPKKKKRNLTHTQAPVPTQ